MKNVLLIARRELGAYLKSPLGYVIAALMLFVDGVLFNVWALKAIAKSSQVLGAFFAFATFMTMVGGILLSMRLIAEEKQLGTLTLLLTSPVREFEIVLGKFISALAFLALINVASVYMPLLIFVNGKVSGGHILAGYLGLLLLGGLALAIGLFASAISPNQIVAVLVGAVLMAAVYLMYLVARQIDPPLREIVGFISPQRHLQWQRGILHLKDIFYFVSGTFLFLLMATHMMQARRWR
jgi:ABC-2 type transport system permease protein